MSSLRTVCLGRVAQWAILAVVTATIIYLTLGLSVGRLQDRPTPVGFSLRPFRNVEFIATQVAAGLLFTPRVAYESLSLLANVSLFWLWGFVALHTMSPSRTTSPEGVVLTLLLGAGLSLGIESVQVFLPERAADVDDVIANVFGTAIGTLHALLRRRFAVEWD